MKIVNCKQASPEWWEAKKGIPSASNFNRIMTPKTRKLAAAADEYIFELIADTYSLTPVNVESYTSRAMQSGIDTEPEARRWFQLEKDLDVQEVGVCISDDGRFCASPDGLIGEDAGLELKCPMLKTHVGYLVRGGVPDEYLPQVHGGLLVSGRKEWWFLSYAPGLPPHLVRVTPDDYTDSLRAVLEEFWTRYQETLNRFLLTAA